MPKPILRVGKMKSSGKSSPAAVEGHNRRTSNCPSCDPSRTHLNRRLIGDDLPFAESIDRVMSRAGLDPSSRRKDATIANDLMISISPEWFRPDNPSAIGTWDEDRLRVFQAEAEALARKTFGPRIVSMDLHLDEATPHIHLVVVPIMPAGVDAEGKKTWRLSGKDMFDPEALKALQQAWEDRMRPHGVGERLKGSRARHTTLKEYYGSLEETAKIDRRNAVSIQSDPPKKGLLESAEQHQAKVNAWKKAEEKRMLKGLEPLAREASRGRLYEVERLAASSLRGALAEQTEELIDRSRKIEAITMERDVTREEVARLRSTPLNEVAAELAFFGEIGPKENAIDLVKRVGEVDYKTAVAWLAQRFGADAAAAAVRDEAQPKVAVLEAAEPVWTKAEATKRQLVQRQLQALSAPAYRVTVMGQTTQGGKEITLNIGKTYHNRDELTPDEVISLIPILARRNAMGGQIYVTPVEPGFHFALVDDLDGPGLASLRSRGYAPATVTETSPGSFQAVLKVRGEKEPVNEWFKDLNRDLGDASITGLAHPFRLAGFENRKEKHRTPEGRFPWVKLHEAVNRLCSRSMAVVAAYTARFAPERSDGPRRPSP